MNRKNISTNLKRFRKILGLNQREFAEPLGIKGGYVSAIEKGRSQLSESVLSLIEINYRLNREWLLNDEGEPFVEKWLEDRDTLFSDKEGPILGNFRMNIEAISRQEAERRKQAESKGTKHADSGEDIPIIYKEGQAGPSEEGIRKDESNTGIGYVFDQIIAIMNSKDPILRRAVLANLDALISLSTKDTQINRMKKQLDSMQKEMKILHSILDDIRKILNKNQPPEGIQERRKSWIEMQKTFEMN